MKQMDSNDEFYIGYLPTAPHATARGVKRIIVLLGIIVVIICVAVVIYQQQFSTSNFEYGIEKTLTGRIFAQPFPHLEISPDPDHSMSQIVMLVGFGKHGAEEFLSKMTGKGLTLSGERITINGQLIYGDGKTLLQVDDESTYTIQESGSSTIPNMASWDKGTFTGKIVDPKCFFGVMKPGEGKPHRSCAIRCLSGGIPPVFVTANEYFVIQYDDRMDLEDILALVDDQISLSGEVTKFEDWSLLRIDSEKIKLLAREKGALSFMNDFQRDMTLCKN